MDIGEKEQVGYRPENFSQFVDNLTLQHLDGWWQGDSQFPALEKRYSLHEQLQREKLLARFLDETIKELSQLAVTQAEKQAKKDRLLNSARKVAIDAMDLPEDQIDTFMKGGFADTALEFASMARKFDPQISAEDVYQAGRNAWSMNLFQFLFGLPVQITPAIFAYSLLYPYSDNYLDDPSVPREFKAAFIRRFSRRLIGEIVKEATPQEARIFQLVGMIEEQYPRVSYPQIYDCLLAIHRAQVSSLRLMRPNASPYEVDVMSIDLEKGGVATLADGYLVAGDLTREQSEFVFGYGALTQLMDDQEDVAVDLASGLLTPFSQTAQGWKLDALTNQLFCYADWTMQRLSQFTQPGAQTVSSLVRTGMRSLIIDAAGRSSHFCSLRYLKALEEHNPFRFSYLKATRKRLARKKLTLARAIEAMTPLI